MIHLLRALAAWRLSFMLVQEDGPARIFETLRRLTGIDTSDPNFVIKTNNYSPLDCVYCTSVWVAFVVPFLPRWMLYALALSAGVIFIDDVKEALDAMEAEREAPAPLEPGELD